MIMIINTVFDSFKYPQQGTFFHIYPFVEALYKAERITFQVFNSYVELERLDGYIEGRIEDFIFDYELYNMNSICLEDTRLSSLYVIYTELNKELELMKTLSNNELLLMV
ncbi:hypothetical protein M3Y14_33995 (plasmid) [Bacillus thuringiensis]|uniref:hypothetical protein n=1 Tax=Bacillus thuringiensis TaxID=1428 RepID=UPI002224E178|nr:hypothetical protein [Bacillus thuringiensis]UYX56261.1 hypothetical protein M3Y14_33995 [Bacillus thuringiensis]